MPALDVMYRVTASGASGSLRQNETGCVTAINDSDLTPSSSGLVSRWHVFIGVDASHCNEPFGELTRTRAAAEKAFERASVEHPNMRRHLVRMRFPANPLACASEVNIVRAA